MKKFKFQIIIVIFLSFICSWYACQKQNNLMVNDLVNTTSNPTTNQQYTVDEVRNRFAQALAKSLVETRVKDFIKEKALRQNNNDLDLFYAAAVGEEVYSGNTFAAILSFYDGQNDLDFFTQTILAIDPNLSILLFNPNVEELSIADWDINPVNKVAVVLKDTDEQTPFLDAYNVGDCAISQVSATTEPNEFILAVRENIDFIAIDPTSSKSSLNVLHSDVLSKRSVLETKRYKYYKHSDVYNTNEVIVANNVNNAERSAVFQRDLVNKDDQLGYVKFLDCISLRTYVPWYEGRARLRFVVSLGKRAGPEAWGFENISKEFVDSRFKFKAGDFYDCDFTIPYDYLTRKNINLNIYGADWDSSEIGTPVKYSWWERDQTDFNAELSASFGVEIAAKAAVAATATAPAIPAKPKLSAAVSGKINYNPKDDDLSEAFVHYRDNVNIPRTVYNTGVLTFTIK